MLKHFYVLFFLSSSMCLPVCAEEDLNDFIGHWVITDLEHVDTGYDAQIFPEKSEFLKHQLIISKEKLEWSPKMAAPDSERKTCFKPIIILAERATYKIKCEDGRYIGPPSYFSFVNKNKLRVTWFDSSDLILSR